MEKELLENDHQVEENSLVQEDYLLPDDFEEETTEETTEEVETEESEELEETENESKEESKEEENEEVLDEEKELLEDLQVKFLHETKALKDIPKDELKEYIQKGMNYDRAQEKLNSANETVDSIKEIASMYETDLNTIVETLKEQYYSNKAEQEGRKVEDVKREYESNKKSRTEKMFNKFLDKYPDVKTDQIPKEVMESVKSGSDLLTEYEKHLANEKVTSKDNEINELKTKLEQLEKKLNTQEQNNKLKKKAVVKKVSETDTTDENDPFLQGFWGE